MLPLFRETQGPPTASFASAIFGNDPEMTAAPEAEVNVEMADLRVTSDGGSCKADVKVLTRSARLAVLIMGIDSNFTDYEMIFHTYFTDSGSGVVRRKSEEILPHLMLPFRVNDV